MYKCDNNRTVQFFIILLYDCNTVSSAVRWRIYFRVCKYLLVTWWIYREPRRHETGIKKTSWKITRIYYKKIMGTSHLNDDLRLQTGPRTAIFVILAIPADSRGSCRKINYLSAPLAVLAAKETGESRWKKRSYVRTIVGSRAAQSRRSKMKESRWFLFSSLLLLGCKSEGADSQSDNEIVKNWAGVTSCRFGLWEEVDSIWSLERLIKPQSLEFRFVMHVNENRSNKRKRVLPFSVYESRQSMRKLSHNNWLCPLQFVRSNDVWSWVCSAD